MKVGDMVRKKDGTTFSNGAKTGIIIRMGDLALVNNYYYIPRQLELCGSNKTKPRPHADFIHAWADGAQIQILRRVGEALVWEDINHPAFRSCNEYRVKPSDPVLEHIKRIEDELKSIKKEYGL